MNYFPRNPPKRTIRGVSNDTDLILNFIVVGQVRDVRSNEVFVD